MEYHVSKLRKRLDMFAILAITEDKDEDEEEKRGEKGKLHRVTDKMWM